MFICIVNILVEYINYRFKAKGRHGVHSPFVYSFINECLNTKIDKKFKIERKKLFKKLKKDQTIISINDFGAGSKKLSKQRSISKTLSTSSSKGKYGDLLYKTSAFYQPKNILEFGTSLGIGTLHFHFGSPNTKIKTVEACENTLKIAKDNFKTTESKNIYPIQSTFNEFLETCKDEKFDLVFIDGHHDGLALLDYLDKLKNFVGNDTIIILDDIRWSKSMLNSWNTIIQDSNYHLTIDLFRMGIIIQRKQQEKEHFILKI